MNSLYPDHGSPGFNGVVTPPPRVDDMALPAGKTCDDCVHLLRCLSFGFTKQHAVRCDFSPSLFQEKTE